MDCPVWCVSVHSEDLRHLEDLSHEGVPVALPVPRHSGPDEPVLRFRLAQWPFTARPVPFVALEAADDGDSAELDAHAVRAFAKAGLAHMQALLDAAAQLTA